MRFGTDLTMRAKFLLYYMIKWCGLCGCRRRGAEVAMMRVAFCDDDIGTLNEMQGLLDQYCGRRGWKIAGRAFRSPVELLAELEQGARFDVLFLDILMPGQNGIETAAEIRNYDTNVKIIFLTSSPEFAVQSYTVKAYFYQLKPLRAEDFFRVLDAALEECRRDQENSLILRCGGVITRIELERLEFCEVIHRTLLFHMLSGKVVESSGSLDELGKQLAPYGCFLRIHRSYIVNLDYVRNISRRAVTMTCLTEIPIPRGKYNEIKDAFLACAFRNRRVNP